GFESKQTESWEDVTRRTTPKVFPHGDECNPYINLADIIAFLTNIKLSSSREHRELRPDNVKAVWESYSFQREVRFLDERLIDKIKWRTKEAIDAGPYLARPMVFLLLDDILRGR